MAEKKKTAYERVSEDRKKLVEKLIEKMKDGKIPSEALWNTLAVRPQNPTSGIYYQGGNRLRLGYAAAENEYKDPRWLTFKQASDLGYKIKKGEHGTLCEKWIFTEKVKEKDDKGNEIEAEKKLEKPVVNYFIVFNAQQIEGVPPLELSEKSKSEMLKIAQDFANSSECTVKEVASERAYYSPSKDEIVIPLKEVFKSDEAYLKTLLHEMGHSTGHSTRLNRDLSGEFGSEKYAKEELTAELTAVFVSGNLGIKLEGEHFNDHSNYLSSWIKAMEDNPNELFSAAAMSEKAADKLQKNYENYLVTEKENTQITAKEEPNNLNMEIQTDKQPVLTTYILEKEIKFDIYEKDDGNYLIKTSSSYDKNKEEYQFASNTEKRKGAIFNDITLSKEGIENYKENIEISKDKGKLLYENIEEIKGKGVKISIHEDKEKSTDYIVSVNRHNSEKDIMETKTFKLNDGEKIPEEEITINKDFIKSKLFEDLEVKFHWSEKNLGVKEGAVLHGVEAYDFIKDLKERDEIKSLTRELDTDSSNYDKTKLEIKYYDSNTGGVLYNTGEIRIDLGDRELANSNTVSEAVRDRLMDFPKYLETIANNDMAPYNELRESKGMIPVNKDELLTIIEDKKTAIEKVFVELDKNEKILQYLEKEVQPMSKSKETKNITTDNSLKMGEEKTGTKTVENKENSSKSQKVKIKAKNFNYNKSKDTENEL